MKSYWLNYGVADLERTIHFYEGIGLKVHDTPNERMVAFKVGNQVMLFQQKASLEQVINRQLTTDNEIIVSFDVATKAEVDELAQNVKTYGGQVISEPQTANGYYGIMFTDPDGHLFNVIVM